MTIIYCGMCDRIVLIGNGSGGINVPISHDVRDVDGNLVRDEKNEPLWEHRSKPKTLSLPDEKWEPEKYKSIDDYMKVLSRKYPKDAQKALV